MSDSLQSALCASLREQPLSPVRGLVPLRNAKGRPYRVTDVHRWLRLNRVVYKTEKVDLLVHGPWPRDLGALVHWTSKEGGGTTPLYMAASLRVDATAPPDDLEAVAGCGLFDVFLALRGADAPHLEAWLTQCRRLTLPVRFQVQPPFPLDFDAHGYAEMLGRFEVKAVNVVLSDPFAPAVPAKNAKEQSLRVRQMNTLAHALSETGIETNLYGLPYCLVENENRGLCGNSQRFFLDHQQYNRGSYELARRLYGRAPHVASIAVSAYLGRYTSFKSRADDLLLEWLVEKRKSLYLGALLWRKLTRHIRFFPNTPKPRAVGADDSVEQVSQLARGSTARLAPTCAACRFRRICDHGAGEVRRQLPGMALTTQPGEVVPSAAPSLASQSKHFDVIDDARRRLSQVEVELAAEANALIANRPPDQTFGFHHYLAENAYHIRMPGAVRWYSVQDNEVLSTIWHWAEAPVTVSVVYGGGLADYVGFALGRAIRLVCPMVAYTHRIVLHVAADGRYVLLRDGTPVRPTEFEGRYYAPLRLPTVFPLQFAMFNIDEHVNTQNLMVWEGAREEADARSKVRFSVLIVSTKYARRLQAVLRAIAHQRDIDLSALEVIVGYVPGVDATDDLLTSMQLTYPGLRIVRSTFPEQKTNAKGFILNESANLAAGEWIVILDSDIILPPDFFARLSKVPHEAYFVAPAGRKMLTRETTAAILLGELDPWHRWDEILEGPGEGRFGEQREGGHLPVGFCQCVRAECLKAIRYHEYEHFEGADWEFAIEMERHYGPCTWLDVPVLHLDHGGSQWYGAQSHQ